MCSPDVGIASYIRTFELIIRLRLSSSKVCLPDSELWRVLYSFTRVEHLKLYLPAESPLPSRPSSVFSRKTLSIYAIPNSLQALPCQFRRHSDQCSSSFPDFISNVTFAFDPNKQPHKFVCQTESIALDTWSTHSIIRIFSGGFTCYPRLGEAFGRLRTLDIRPYCDVDFLNLVATAIGPLETLFFQIGRKARDIEL